jgi:hypothetical protein
VIYIQIRRTGSHSLEYIPLFAFCAQKRHLGRKANFSKPALFVRLKTFYNMLHINTAEMRLFRYLFASNFPLNKNVGRKSPEEKLINPLSLSGSNGAAVVQCELVSAPT